MSDTVIYGLLGLLGVAIVGLGIKLTISNRSKRRDTTVIKNVKAGGDIVGRDKKS